MKEIQNDVKWIAKCGLYCGSCPRFLKEKCPGCLDYHKATWCKLRTCCLEKKIASCTDCNEYENVMDCGKYDNFIARVFGWVFNSDRSACIARIRQIGYEGFAREMTENKVVTFKRKAGTR